MPAAFSGVTVEVVAELLLRVAYSCDEVVVGVASSDMIDLASDGRRECENEVANSVRSSMDPGLDGLGSLADPNEPDS